MNEDIYSLVCEAVNAELLTWAQEKRADIPPGEQIRYPTVAQPFILRSYGFELAYPINPDPEKLPSLTLTYGGMREGPEGLVQANSRIFTLTMYAVVKALEETDFESGERDNYILTDGVDYKPGDYAPRDLLTVCTDMHAAMTRLALKLDTLGLATADGHGVVDRVVLARMRSGEGKFSGVEFLQFYFDFYITEALPSVFP